MLRWAAAAPPYAGVIPDGTRHDLLQEVSNLVESPTVVLGGFDPAFLALPRWVWVPTRAWRGRRAGQCRCQGSLFALIS